MMDEARSEIDINQFLKSNSELFVVLGVFSALAIYISQLNDGPLSNAPLETRIGFAGALLLALLVLVLIYNQLVEIAGSLENLIRAHARPTNLDLIIFTTGILFLVPSLGAPLLEYQSALYYILGVASLVLLVPLIFETALLLRKALPENLYLRSGITIVSSSFVYFISSRVVNYVRTNPQLVGTSQFSLNNVAPVFYDVLSVVALLVQVVSMFAGIFAAANVVTEINSANESDDAKTS